MDYGRFLGSLIFFVAPPLGLLAVRKLSKNPPSATPLWQYAAVFAVMSVLTMTGPTDHKLIVLAIGALVYVNCYYVESRPPKR